jgi:Tat protein secretion system quality control protein TatD with DNase activity
MSVFPTGSQLSLAKKYHLPLFLHSRAAHADFVKILTEEGFGKDGGRAVGAAGGVVHSFTGTAAEAAELVSRLLFLILRPHSRAQISMGFHLR